MQGSEGLFVEYARSPLAVGNRLPRFSWEVPLAGRNRRQAAFHLLVATAPDLLQPGRADLWDSGRLESSQSMNVAYAGKPLRSNMDCYWCVRVWDEAGDPTSFSAPAYFGTALLDDGDWQAQWIGMADPDEPVSDPDLIPKCFAKGEDAGFEKLLPALADFEPEPRAPLLRKEFAIGTAVKRARAFVCGLGLCELRLNGAKVGEDVLATPRTEFRKRVLYATYDITGQLQEGTNAVGVILGNGWYNGQRKYWKWAMPWFGSPRAIVQLEIELVDGSRMRVCSDDSWQGDWSPITFNCIYDGEDYDATLAQPGWDAPGFDGGKWPSVHVLSSPGGRLVPMDHAANRVMKRWIPVSVSEPEPGVFVFDMGTVMTGWAALRIPRGRAGEVVTLRYAELLHGSGMIDPSTAGGARQTERYTMSGMESETYEPRFTYHGFRYVELTGFPGIPAHNTLEACFVYSVVEQSGTFACGNELISRIHACTLQSQCCNLQMGVPTDDTQRAERLGWCGDAWSFAEESMYNLDSARFWAKWIADLIDQQDADGLVGYITPLPGFGEDLVWSAAFVLIPWWHYCYYGDRRILEENYHGLQKYIAYLERVGQNDIPPLPPDQVGKVLLPASGRANRFPSSAQHGCLQRSFFGDHLSTHEGSSGFCKDHPRSMATAFYYHDVTTMIRIAETLGLDADAQGYRELALRIKAAYNDYFFDENLGYYDIGCQSAQAFAIAFDLVPEAYKERVIGYLNSSVNFRQRRITSGYAGTKWVINAIGRSGRHDILWNRATATDYPSWGYMLAGNKTTITENWAGGASQCHTTLGAAIDEWFYWGLAGIRPDEAGPGFEKIIFKPYLPADLPWTEASLQTRRGRVASAWRQDKGEVTLRITVPANSTATVHIPCNEPAAIKESGVPAEQAAGIMLLGNDEKETVFSVGSGDYDFAFTVSRRE